MQHPATTSLSERFPRGWVEPLNVAEELGVHHQTVLSWIKSGDLTAFGIGAGGRGPYRVYLPQLDDFLARRSQRDGTPTETLEPVTAPDPAPGRPAAPRKRRNTGLVAA